MVSISFFISVICFIGAVESKSEAMRETVPTYMVQINMKPGDSFLCAGAIIGPRFILTSATCIADYPVNVFEVVGGATYQPSLKGVKRDVSAVFTPSATGKPHPDLDVAILKLASALEGRNITTIPVATLAPKTTDVIEFIGLVEKKEKTPPGVIKIPLISRSDCMKKYGPYLVEIADTMLCGYGGSALKVGNCFSPSGSPVVHNGQVIGVISSAETCGYGKSPALMASVAHFQDFIEKSLRV